MAISTRLVVAGAIGAVVIAIAACGSDSDSEDESGGGSLTIAAFGGAYGEAEQAAYFDPFTEETGIEVKVLQAEPTLGAMKLQVDKGNVEWDVTELPGPDNATACREGLAEPVDYELVDKADLAPDAGLECGILASLFTMGIGYNTEAVKQPPDWDDFFDTKTYPGKRTMEQYLTDGTLEHALIADGVDKDQLYPLDLDRSIAKLETLGDDIIYVDSLAVASQLLASGEVDMVQTASGRILPLQNAGLPVDFSPVGLRGISVFTIPKGAPNTEQAQEFFEFIASCAECSQEMAQLTAYAGPNKDGEEGLPPTLLELMPTSAAIQKQTFRQDDAWWSENAEEAQSAFDQLLTD